MRKYFSKIKTALKEFFTENSIKLFPVKDAVKEYQKKDIKYDVKAALNVALLTIPSRHGIRSHC